MLLTHAACDIFAGEFGEVYKAHLIRSSVLSSHPAMPEIVAVKTIKGKLHTVIVQLYMCTRSILGQCM